MRGIPGTAFFIFLCFIILIEVLTYLSFRRLLHDPAKKKHVTIIYWLLSATILAIWLTAFLNPERIRETENYEFFYFVICISILNFIPKLVISCFFIVSAFASLLKAKSLSKALLMSGMIISLGTLLTLGAGIFAGRKVLRVEKLELSILGLPKELDGMSIVQISDIHLGSFQNDDFLQKCAKEVNELSPDLILFTGDLVNNYYSETVGFESVLSEMKASHGKYAILGNHDYGDYSNWNSEEEKKEDHQKLCNSLEKSGFQLLLNSAKKLQVCDTSLYLIGVENWGHPPFPQYAKLEKAIVDVPEKAFKILLSHDPAHWEARVLPETNIQLTLSGHTHGAQTGFRLAGIEFSPMFLIQKHWGGLYSKNNRFLYVNRGLGCVGLLGRIDMSPEITFIRLRSNVVETN